MPLAYSRPPRRVSPLFPLSCWDVGSFSARVRLLRSLLARCPTSPPEPIDLPDDFPGQLFFARLCSEFQLAVKLDDEEKPWKILEKQKKPENLENAENKKIQGAAPPHSPHYSTYPRLILRVCLLFLPRIEYFSIFFSTGTFHCLMGKFFPQKLELLKYLKLSGQGKEYYKKNKEESKDSVPLSSSREFSPSSPGVGGFFSPSSSAPSNFPSFDQKHFLMKQIGQDFLVGLLVCSRLFPSKAVEILNGEENSHFPLEIRHVLFSSPLIEILSSLFHSFTFPSYFPLLSHIFQQLFSLYFQLSPLAPMKLEELFIEKISQNLLEENRGEIVTSLSAPSSSSSASSPAEGYSDGIFLLLRIYYENYQNSRLKGKPGEIRQFPTIALNALSPPSPASLAALSSSSPPSYCPDQRFCRSLLELGKNPRFSHDSPLFPWLSAFIYSIALDFPQAAHYFIENLYYFIQIPLMANDFYHYCLELLLFLHESQPFQQISYEFGGISLLWEQFCEKSSKDRSLGGIRTLMKILWKVFEDENSPHHEEIHSFYSDLLGNQRFSRFLQEKSDFYREFPEEEKEEILGKIHHYMEGKEGEKDGNGNYQGIQIKRESKEIYRQQEEEREKRENGEIQQGEENIQQLEKNTNSGKNEEEKEKKLMVETGVDSFSELPGAPSPRRPFLPPINATSPSNAGASLPSPNNRPALQRAESKTVRISNSSKLFMQSQEKKFFSRGLHGIPSAGQKNSKISAPPNIPPIGDRTPFDQRFKLSNRSEGDGESSESVIAWLAERAALQRPPNRSLSHPIEKRSNITLTGVSQANVVPHVEFLSDFAPSALSAAQLAQAQLDSEAQAAALERSKAVLQQRSDNLKLLERVTSGNPSSANLFSAPSPSQLVHLAMDHSERTLQFIKEKSALHGKRASLGKILTMGKN